MTEAKTFPVELLTEGYPNSTVFCLGSHGSGKTTLMANLIRKESRYVIFDTKRDYDPKFFGDSVAVCMNRAEFQSALNSGKIRIIVALYSDSMPEGLLSECCQDLFKFQTQNFDRLGAYGQVTVCLDELNAYVSPSECSPGLKDICQRGRSVGIKKIFGAQWFGTIPAWMRDGFSEIYAFRHLDGAGLSRLGEFGMSVDEVATLPQFTCLHAKGLTIERLNLSPTNKQTTQKE